MKNYILKGILVSDTRCTPGQRAQKLVYQEWRRQPVFRDIDLKSVPFISVCLHLIKPFVFLTR